MFETNVVENFVSPVINDAHGCPDYWVLQLLGLAKRVSGFMVCGPPTLSPSVCSIPIGKRTLIHTRQIALCKPKSQTKSGGMACQDFFALNLFRNISNDIPLGRRGK